MYVFLEILHCYEVLVLFKQVFMKKKQRNFFQIKRWHWISHAFITNGENKNLIENPLQMKFIQPQTLIKFVLCIERSGPPFSVPSLIHFLFHKTIPKQAKMFTHASIKSSLSSSRTTKEGAGLPTTTPKCCAEIFKRIIDLLRGSPVEMMMMAGAQD